MEFEGDAARTRTWKMAASGSALLALSAPLAIAAYPGVAVDESGSLHDTGSAWWCWVASIVAGLGVVLLLVGIIALGVVLGLRASQAA